MMMTLLSLIISFAVGITVGLQIKRIVDGLYAALHKMQTAQTNVAKKNTGVVRPGYSNIPELESDTIRSSSVVRPKPMVDIETEEHNATLEAVRRRVGQQ